MNSADTNAKGPAMNRADQAPGVAIYLAYHKNSQRLASDVLHPVHVGRALADDATRALMADMPGDDTGDNISAKNPLFCELTLQYWVWKNRMDADYIGFLHYRRQLNFNPAAASKPFSDQQPDFFPGTPPKRTVIACMSRPFFTCRPPANVVRPLPPSLPLKPALPLKITGGVSSPSTIRRV